MLATTKLTCSSLKMLMFLQLQVCLGIVLAIVFAEDENHQELCAHPMDFQACPYRQYSPVRNVARCSTAFQSTNYYYGGAASLAIDGDTEQRFWTGETCTHTAEHRVEDEKFPWLRLDFGKRYVVTDVRIYSRNDNCCADRYHDIQVRVGDHVEDGLGQVFSQNNLCSEIEGGGFEQGHVFNLTCAPCLAGQHLSVQIVRNCTECQIPDYNILSICELEVYGYPV